MCCGTVPAFGAAARALDYLRGLLSPVERKNGWQLAEQAWRRDSLRGAALASTYRWDADLVVKICPDMLFSIWLRLTVCWWWTRPVPQEGRQVGGGAAPVQRHGRADRKLSGWRIPGLCWRQRQDIVGPGVVFAPGMGGGPGTASGSRGAGGGKVPNQATTGPEDAGTGGGVWSSPSAGLLETRFTAVTASCGGGWRSGEIPHVLAVKRNEKLWAWTDKGQLQVRADRLRRS